MKVKFLGWKEAGWQSPYQEIVELKAKLAAAEGRIEAYGRHPIEKVRAVCPKHCTGNLDRDACDTCKIETENARLREALEEIASESTRHSPYEVARAALKGPKR